MKTEIAAVVTLARTSFVAREVALFDGDAEFSEETKNAIDNYVQHGVRPGSFVEAILMNDLKGSVLRADAANRQCLPALVTFLMNAVPSDAWGSKRGVNRWIAEHATQRVAALKNAGAAKEKAK